MKPIGPIGLIGLIGFIGLIGLISPINVYAFTGPTATPPNNAGQVLYQSGGKLGIGTSSPRVLLNIKPVSAGAYPTLGSDSGQFFIGGDTNLYGLYAGTHSGGNAWLQVMRNDAATAYNLIFQPVGGYVGIATTTPAEVLHVIGNVKASGSFIGALSGGLSAANVTGPSAFGSNYGTYNYAVPGAFAIGTTTVTGLPSNGLYVVGNVGIGTTGPSTKLNVFGNSGNWAGIPLVADFNSNTTDGAAVNVQTANGLGTFTVGSTGNVLIGAGTAAKDLALWAGGNEKMRILSTGNVGIGTSTPSYKLDVQGGQINASGGLCIAGSCQTSWAAVGQWTTTSTGIYYNGGNVGIGTASPQNKLNIDTTTDNDGLSVRKSGVLMGRIVQNGATGAGRLDLYSGGTNTIQLAANATSYFNSGNVGIGTTTPSNIFEVVGASKNVVFRGSGLTDDARFEFNNFGGSGGNRRLVFSASSPSIQSLFTNTGGVASLHLQPSGGNVGIATTTPSEKLHVIGNVKASGSFIGALSGSLSAANVTGPSAFGTNYGTYAYAFPSYLAVGTTTTTGLQHALTVNGAMYSIQYNLGTKTTNFTVDWNNGNTQHAILGATGLTITFSNGQAGGRYTLILKQGATGGPFTVSWPATVRFGSAGLPTLSPAANATDYVGFVYNGVDAKYDMVAFNAGF